MYYTSTGFSVGDEPLYSEVFFKDQTSQTRMAELHRERTKVFEANKNGSPLYLCACCHKPLKICGRPDGHQKYHFRHLYRTSPAECPFESGKTLTNEEIARLIFNGKSEGPKHKHVKSQISQLLGREFGESKVKVEERIKINGREWRRPDINVDTPYGNIAFEIQLAPISQENISARNAAYRGQGNYIIWVFDSFEDYQNSLFWQRDAASRNLENFFIFDEAVEAISLSHGRLFIKVFYRSFYNEDGLIKDSWVSKICSLSDLTFDRDRHLVYYIDCEQLERNAKNIVTDIADKECLEQESISQESKNDEGNHVLKQQDQFDCHASTYSRVNEDFDMSPQIESRIKRLFNSVANIDDFLEVNALFEDLKHLEKSGQVSEDKVRDLRDFLLKKLKNRPPYVSIMNINWSSINPIWCILQNVNTNDISLEALTSFYNWGYELTEEDEYCINDKIEELFSQNDKKNLTESQRKFIFDLLMMKCIGAIAKEKDIKIQEYVSLIRQHKTFLKIVIYMWCDLNLTGREHVLNFSQMCNYIVLDERKKDYAFTFMNVYKKCENKSRLVDKNRERWSEIVSLAEQRRTSDDIRYFIKILLHDIDIKQRIQYYTN